MNCEKCGAKLEANDIFCPICGTKVPNSKQDNNVGIQDENDIFSYERPVEHKISYKTQQTNVQMNDTYNNKELGEKQVRNNTGKTANNSSNSMKIAISVILVIIILLAIICGIGLVVKSLLGDKKTIKNELETNTSSSYSKDTNSETDGNLNVIVGDDTNSTTGNQNTNSSPNIFNRPVSTYTVKFGGFNLYIPDTLVYQVNNGNESLNIGNIEDTWIAEIMVGDLSYQTLKQNINSLKATAMKQFASYNPTISDAKVENIGGVEFILLEVELQGDTILVGYTQLNSMYTATVLITSQDEEFDREALKTISPIFTNAEYTGDTANIKASDKIKITDMNKILKKVVK